MTDEFREEVVIVGMAGRFPGAASVAELWGNLRDGVESIRSLSADELAAAGVDPVRAASDDYVPAAAPLEHADAFDATFFGYTPRDAQIMDPQHRVFLECAWSALEDAGYDPATCPGSVGLFGGVGPNTYRQQVLETRPDILASLGRYPLLIGSEREYAISRAAFKLGLKGPVVAVATACSTSGVALHLACQSVLSGECDTALAGGARVAVPLGAGYVYEEDGILSPDGHCRTFDADARGTVVGSGVAIVVVKRLSDALRDGDTIRAIIKGTAINNDGADKIGFTAPGVSGQESVIRQALEMADVDASSIGYVEAHGTGTFLGDPIEVEALTRAYRADTDAVGYCGIGSLKTNIGHLDAGAGVAGVIKATLALESGEIPPSLNFSAPNPQIDFGASPFRVIDRLTAWPSELSPRRAAVSSFGLGGTNAHVVLEQPPAVDRSTPSTRDHQLFVVSGRTERSLDRATRALAEHLERRPDLEPADVAHTLGVGRQHQRRRRAVVASDCLQAARALHAAVERPVGEAVSDRPTVFMFPGGGAQYAGMGQRLHATEPAFRRAFDRCADLSEQSLGVDLRALVFGAGEPAELERPALALPALFATEYAMARLLESLAVRPGIMIGHSLGEYTAACLAGVMGLEDALALVALRGRLFEELPPGAMISVQLPAADLERRLGDDLSIAVINKPDLCTVAGSDGAVADLERQLAGDGVETRRLRIAVAAHSHLVEPILARFEEFAATIDFSEPQIPFVSNLTGRVVEPGEVTRPAYWVAHLRSTVRFVDGLATALRGEAKVAVEVGPGQTLSGFARQQPGRVDGQVVVPTLPHPSEKTPDDAFFLTAVGKLWAAGVPVELTSLHAGEQRFRVPLPTYPFERDRHWIERAALSPAQVPASGNGRANGGEVLLRQPEPVASPAPRDRRSWIQERLLEEFSALSGMSAQELDTRASFLELGFDSLFMTQAASAISAAFGTKVSFRHLLEEAPTLDALARWLDERLPEDQGPAHVAQPTGESPVPGLDELAAQLAAIQRQVTALAGGQPIQQQASALSGGQPSVESTLDDGEVTPDVPAGPPPAEPTGPWRPPERRSDDLDPEQLRHLQALTERLTSRTGGSKAATASNRGHLADPRTVAGFRRTWKEIVYPIVADRSAGSKLWDIDGNEYLDVAMGFGVNLFGHSPPFVIDAVTAQLARGIEIGPQTPLAGETAALIAEMTGHQRVAFCNTGSEAVLAAMRLARTVTGRSKIVTFAHDYHGLFDEVLARGVLRNGQRRSLPIAPGIPDHAAQDLIIFDYGDPEALRYVAEHASELAAVLVEPVQSRYPEIRPVEFLRELRRSTAATGVALVFDEMITGFRAHPGGAQALFGVRADLATYGKVLGGGFPIGVVAGQARFMDALDGGEWRYGDDSIPEADVTWFAGTFVRHPIALAASRAVLEHLRAAGPALQANLNARTTAFAGRLNDFLQELDVPIRIEHFSSLFLTRFSRGQGFASLFYFHLRDQGVHITEGRGAFLSTAHSDADLERLDAAYRAAASAMKSAGFLSGARTDSSRSKVRELPVTEGQQEILLAASLSTAANCSYNLANTLHITGPIDVDALRRALDRVVARHEGLRVTFTTDLRRQRIAHELAVELSVVDLSEGDREASEAALAERRAAEVETPFDLQAGPLIRVALLRMAAEEHHLFLTVHHAVCDGWSSGTVLRNLVEAYTAERRGTAVDESSAMQLSEYVDWFDRYLKSEARVEDERFWAAHVAHDFPTTELPADNPRSTTKTYGAHRQELPLDRDLVADLRRLAAVEGTTLFALLLASFECLLARLTRSSEVALGVTIGGHTQFPGRELVAHCVNLLPLRRAVDPNVSFSKHLATTQTAILDAFEHQNLSYGAIVRTSGIRRDQTRTPLVTVTFNMDSPSDPLDMDGAVAVPGSSPRHYENFDVFVNIVPRGDELVIEVTYNTGLFEASTLRRWLSHYDTLLRGIVARPECALDALPVLNEGDKRTILDEWNATNVALPDEKRLHRLFEAQVSRSPDAQAVVDGTERVSYKDLNARANRLAHHLRRAGIGPGMTVGVCLERRANLVVALFAVLKAGGAYVPLDPAYPKDRVAYMLKDSRARAVITQADLAAAFDVSGAERIVVDADADRIASECSTDFEEGATNTDLAYVIYTSGSTGVPKGVAIEHRSAGTLVHWARTVFSEHEIAGVLASTSVCFDLSVFEIFFPLAFGGRVILADHALDIASIPARDEVTLVNTVPSAVAEIVRARAMPPSVETVCLAGEPLPTQLVDQIYDSTQAQRVFDLYGPSEDTTYSTFALREPGARATIGHPIANTRAYVLDKSREPVPIGAVGELYLAGDGLARGYLYRDELTAERFVSGTFGGRPVERAYRTGDLARYRPDGALEFVGRTDHQVKIRGFRIELGEIEGALAEQQEVQDAVVVVREDRSGDKRLVAYVVPQSDPAGLADRLRSGLRDKLPGYMVPAHFVVLAALPQTPNGKVDRESLPSPDVDALTAGTRHVAPRTPTEVRIAAIWADALGIASPGIHDDFFDLGGHSLTAAQVVTTLRSAFQVDAAMRHLFERPTIAGLAEIIDVLGVSVGDGDRGRDAPSDREEIEI